MKKLTLVFSSLLLSSSSALALENIIRPYQSARSAGMGGVLHTTGNYEENFFGNPARATAMNKWRFDPLNITLEVNSGALDNFDRLSSGGDTISNVSDTAGNNNHVRIQTLMPAFYKPRFLSEKNYFAIGLIQSTQGDIALRKSFNIEPSVYVDLGPAMTFARKFKDDRLSIGTTVHYMYRMTTSQTFTTLDYLRGVQFSKVTDEAAEGTMLDADIGATYQIPWKPRGKWILQPGVTIQRVAGGNFSKGSLDLNSKSDLRPANANRTFNLGVSGSRPSWLFMSSFTGALEFQDIGNNPNGSIFRTIHLGAEAGLLRDWLRFRAGINQGYPTFGVGIDLRLIDIDFATYGEEMSLNAGGLEDRRYILRFAITI